MRSFVTLVAAATGLLAPLITRAQEYPTLGLLYNTSEMHSMVFRCERPQGGQLSCEFTQTSIRPKATFADLATTIDKARKAFASEKPPSSEDCAGARQVLQILQGKQAAPKPDAAAALTEVSKRDAAALMTALATYCDSPSEDLFVSMIRVGAEKDRRTCQVSSNTFRQTFTRATASQSLPTWLAESKPEGECGVVQLSRFEPEVTRIGKSNFTNWKFIARKAITNPSGEFFPGAKCSGLDERPYVYDWRAKEHQLTCDYIEFSPL